MRRALATGMLLVTLSLAAAGCGARPADPAPEAAPAGADDPEPDTEPLYVGLLLPAGGAYGRFARGMHAAAELAVRHVNAAGGPGGRPLAAIPAGGATGPGGGASDSAGAARLALGLIRDRGAAALAGVADPTAALELAGVAVAERVPLFHSGLARELSDYDDLDLVWQFHASWSVYGQALARAALHQGWRTAAILAEDAPGPRDLAAGFAEWYGSWGGRAAKTVTVAAAEPEGGAAGYREAVAAVLRDPVDVAVLLASPARTTALLEAWAGTGVPQYWLLPAEAVEPAALERLGAERWGYLRAAGVFPDVQGAAYRRTEPEYSGHTGEAWLENPFAAQVYDQLVVLALAMEACGCRDAAGLAQAIRRVAGPPGVLVHGPADGLDLLRKGRSVDYEGVSGPLDFDRRGDVLVAFALFAVEDGRLRPAGMLPVTKPPR